MITYNIYNLSMSVGIPTEFQIGDLVCGHSSNVQLSRQESGSVMIEGCLSKEYYTIRDLLYVQTAVVYGGEGE